MVCAKTTGTPLPPVTGPVTAGEAASACAAALSPADTRSAPTTLHIRRRITTIPHPPSSNALDRSPLTKAGGGVGLPFPRGLRSSGLAGPGVSMLQCGEHCILFFA